MLNQRHRSNEQFPCNVFWQTLKKQNSVLANSSSTIHFSPTLLQVTDYLYDAPILLQLLARGVGTMGGLVGLFFLRVALCCLGTVVAFSGSPLETIPTTESVLETAPSLGGLLGALDDLVVVVLLLTCVININQQMAPERRLRQGSPAANSANVMGSSMSDHTVGLGPRWDSFHRTVEVWIGGRENVVNLTQERSLESIGMWTTEPSLLLSFFPEEFYQAFFSSKKSVLFTYISVFVPCICDLIAYVNFDLKILFC